MTQEDFEFVKQWRDRIGMSVDQAMLESSFAGPVESRGDSLTGPALDARLRELEIHLESGAVARIRLALSQKVHLASLQQVFGTCSLAIPTGAHERKAVWYPGPLPSVPWLSADVSAEDTVTELVILHG